MNEKAYALAETLRSAYNSSEWDEDDLSELCGLAGMTEEWDAAGEDTYKAVAYAAADKLGVTIASDLMRIHDTLKAMVAEAGGIFYMTNEQLHKYLDTCQSWDEIEDGAMDEFIERAGLEEDWQRVQDGELSYEEVLNDACKKLGFPNLV